MKSFLISFSSQNNLNTLLLHSDFKINEHILLETSQSKKNNWSQGFVNQLRTQKFNPIILDVESDTDFNEIYSKVFDAIDKNTGKGDRILINISTGSRIHNVLFWDLFYQLNYLNKGIVEVVYCDLESKIIHLFSKKDYQIVQEKLNIKTILNIDKLLGLYELSSNSKNTLVYNYLTPNNMNFDNTPDENLDAGFKFEKEMVKLLFESMSINQKIISQIAYIYSGLKIFSAKENNSINEKPNIIAEYDILIQDKRNQIYIIEIKMNYETPLKAIESQMKLADKWGGRFSKFGYITMIKNNLSLQNQLLSKYKMFKNKKIISYFHDTSGKLKKYEFSNLDVFIQQLFNSLA